MTVDRSGVRETVVLVHGTFSGPDEKIKRWWQPGAHIAFTQRLDAKLKDQGSPARCWAHCKDGEPSLFWTGNNHWVDRYWAVHRLRQHVMNLHKDGWTCHLVGHSHGGNVIAEALHLLQGTPEKQAIRSVVTLGTPFIDVHGPIENRIVRRFLMIIIGGMVPAIALAGLMVAEIIRNRAWTDGAQAYGIAAAVISLVFFLMWHVQLRFMLPHRFRKDRNAVSALALNSGYDEAWQLLHHVRSTPNPLAVKVGLWRYLVGRLKAASLLRYEAGKTLAVRQTAALVDTPSKPAMRWLFRLCYALIIASIFIVPVGFYPPAEGSPYFALFAVAFGIVLCVCLTMLASFLLVALVSLGSKQEMNNFSKPIQLFATSLFSLPIVPSEIVTYLVRKQSWTLLQRWALGLDGYRYALPNVTTVPERAGGTTFTYESLPSEIAARAMAARSEWIQHQIGSASDLFSKLVLSATDVAAMLGQIERDQSLVHASYYTDEECVARVAAWICKHSHEVATELPAG